MSTINRKNMKVISVLTYPFENRMMVKVTRGEGYNCYPMIEHQYSIDYDSPRFYHFARWSRTLHNLHLSKLYMRMKEKYGNKTK